MKGLPATAWRLLVETDWRVLRKLLFNMCWKGMLAVRRFEKRLRRGEHFPAFLFISVTNDCNLSCQGCWVSRSGPPLQLEPEQIDAVIDAGRKKGCRFFGILGGEPLLYPGLLDVLARHPDCYFQVFTNGTTVTEEVGERLRRLGNVTPLVSIEGLERVSDERRGGSGVYGSALRALEIFRRNRLVIGVATSVCRSNFDELVTERFVNDVAGRGVHYLWYYIYRPVGPQPCPELALSEEQILALREFLVDVRGRARLAVVDTYWDHEGRALCPAATGISHHVGPGGDVEPCPPVQLAAENISDGRGIVETVAGSRFLADFRERATATTRGCLLMEAPEVLRELAASEGARDTSGRDFAGAELAAMKPVPGHHQPGKEIPEKSWFYRFAKRHWFFGFGAYG
ncbi:MAG: radical SAM protein [Planctomycetota bacterium]